MWWKRLFWAVIGLSLAFGLWGFYDRIFHGHENAAYGSYLVWGLWVAVYMFLAGLAAGMFIIASLDYLFKIRLFAGTGRLALLASFTSLMAGLLLIWFDQGHMERIWRIFFSPNFGSIMTQVVWLYTAFAAVVVALLVLVLPGETRTPSRSPWAVRGLFFLGIVLALALSSGVGALLGAQAARPFWHVGLFPVQIPIFSLASAAALMLVLLFFFGDRKSPGFPRLLGVVAVSTLALQFVKLFLMWTDFAQSIYTGEPMNVIAIETLIFGPYWYSFWVFQIALGSLLPIAILLVPRFRASPGWAMSAGSLILLGFVVARANILFPALAVPEIEALRDAFFDPRLVFDYFPSLSEWALAIGVAGGAVGFFYLAATKLALTKTVKETA